MFNALVLSAALSLGQTGTPAPDPIATVAFDPEVVPAAADQPPAAADQPPAALPEKEPVQIAAPLLPPPAPPPAAAAAAAAAAAPPARWILMKELQGTYPGSLLDGTRTSVYGWVDTSATTGTAGANNLPLLFNYKANEVEMQQAWFRINRAVVTSGTTEPTYGYQADIYVGTDYRWTLSRGLFNKQLTEDNGSPNIYGVDAVQFYGEAYYPTICRGLDVKVGKFYAPWGVESIEAVSTPFLSRSYTFAVAPPFTYSGFLATLTLTPLWTVQAGIVAGNDVILFNTSDTPTFVGTVQWTQSGGRNVVKFATSLNSDRFDIGGAFQNYDIFDVVWTHTFNPVLIYNLEGIVGFEQNIPDQTASDGSTVHIGTANWEGLAQYIQYTVSPRLTAQARFELFNDPQGIRTSSFTLTNGPPTVTDAKGLYEAVTVGLSWAPRMTKAIIVRPELRYDYNDESAPFEGHHGLFTASTDLIVRW